MMFVLVKLYCIEWNVIETNLQNIIYKEVSLLLLEQKVSCGIALT